MKISSNGSSFNKKERTISYNFCQIFIRGEFQKKTKIEIT